MVRLNLRQNIKVLIEYVILQFLCVAEYRTTLVKNAHAHVFGAMQLRNVVHHMLMAGQILGAQLEVGRFHLINSLFSG